MQEKESIIVVWWELKTCQLGKSSYNHVCKNMYSLFGTVKLKMSQMLF